MRCLQTAVPQTVMQLLLIQANWEAFSEVDREAARADTVWVCRRDLDRCKSMDLNGYCVQIPNTMRQHCFDNSNHPLSEK